MLNKLVVWSMVSRSSGLYIAVVTPWGSLILAECIYLGCFIILPDNDIWVSVTLLRRRRQGSTPGACLCAEDMTSLMQSWFASPLLLCQPQVCTLLWVPSALLPNAIQAIFMQFFYLTRTPPRIYLFQLGNCLLLLFSIKRFWSKTRLNLKDRINGNLKANWYPIM